LTKGEERRKRPRTIITTHLNADFDAVSSAIAAKRLHPQGEIVLPGSQEREIRRFFEGHPAIRKEFIPLRLIDLSCCKELVIVDTRQKDRIGRFAELLDREDILVTLYDHHREGPNAIHADSMIFQELGANSTMMVGLLRARSIQVTPEEATLFALGIYEDTGSFQFASTTPEDFKQAAWLIEQGADLNEIYRLMSKRFTPSHIELLNDLMANAQKLVLRGVSVCIAKTSYPEYVEDFSVIVHELMAMERVPALFVLALLGDQVLVVGRSREGMVDCGEVLKGLGGGGHQMAASATLKGVTLMEAEERLVRELYRVLGAEPKVSDIMSTPVLFVPPDATIIEAHDALTRYGITVLAVLEGTRCIGFISRRTVEKAIYHGLRELPVSDYMTTDFKVVSPSDTFGKVQDIIVQERQRFVPVVEGEQCVGVITRTDLLQILTEDSLRHTEPLFQAKEQKKHIGSLLRERLPGWLYSLLGQLGEVGDELGMGVYVVGGFVRDLLLREENLDLDVVVEGDGIRFAMALKERYQAKVRPHERFKTARVIFKDGFNLDVATARLEYYEYPAAMPTVSLSSLKLDLYRRDFTINTLAIKLNSKDFGLLIDFFGGQRDIKDKTIRVLHSLSFVEDPTRVFRAVRFEQRFGFRIGKHTLRLIKNARKLNIFERLSGKRLFTELRSILSTKAPERSLLRLGELDLLGVIHRDLILDETILERIEAAKGVLSWYELLFRPKRPRRWLVFFLDLTSKLSTDACSQLCEHLDLSGPYVEYLTTLRDQALKVASVLEEHSRLLPSKIYRLCRPLPLEHQLFIMSLGKRGIVREGLSRYITEYQDVTTHLTGDDLKALGIRPGPVYRRILDRLLDACLDQEARGRDDELRIVKEEFADYIEHEGTKA